MMDRVWTMWLRVWIRLLPELRRLPSPESQQRALRYVGDCTVRSARYWLVFGSLIAAYVIIDRVAGLTPAIRRAGVPGLGFAVFLLIGAACIPLLHMFIVPLQRATLRRYLRDRGIAVCMQCGGDLTGNSTGRCTQCGAPSPPSTEAPANGTTRAGD